MCSAIRRSVGRSSRAAVQRAQVRRIAALGKTGGTLDYVTAWFLQAGEYVQKGPARIGFVATNSITQGEQVAQLWPTLFDRARLEVAFAHRTFAWGSGRSRQGPRARGHNRARRPGARAGGQAPVQLSRHQRRAGGNAFMPFYRRTCSMAARSPIRTLSSARKAGR